MMLTQLLILGALSTPVVPVGQDGPTPGPDAAGPSGPSRPVAVARGRSAGPSGPSTPSPSGPVGARGGPGTPGTPSTPGPAGPSAPVVGDADELELRIHDLSDLADVPEERWDLPTDSLLSPPFRIYDAEEYFDGAASQGDEWVSVERVTNLVSEVFSEEFDYEGRRIDVDGEGNLIVVGPPSLHEGIERLVEFYRSSIAADTVLDIMTARLPKGHRARGGAEDSPYPASLVPMDEVSALLDGAMDRRSYRVSLRGDDLGLLESGRTSTLVVDYDVEIAQGSAIADPITINAHSGLRASLRVAPAPGGMHLAYVLRRAELLDPGTRQIGLSARLGSEGGKPMVTHDVSSLHAFHADNRSMGSEVFLPDNHALVLLSSLPGTGDGRTDVVVLQRASGRLPLRSTLELTRPGETLEVFDLGAVRPPRLRPSGYLAARGFLPDQLFTGKHVALVEASVEDGDLDLYAEAIFQGAEEHCSRDHYGRHALLRPYGEQDPEGVSGAADEQAAAIALFEAMQATTAQYEVSLVARRDGQAVVEARTVVRDGGTTVLTVGQERLRVADYDVEVAQLSSVPDPRTRVVFDGLCLWLSPRVQADGNLSLTLHGGAHLVDEWISEDIGSFLYEGLDREVARHALTNGTRRLRPDAHGGWTTWIGDKDGTDPVVWVVVRPL